MESTKETGCKAPEGPVLCVNNCGFFGSPATKNMCSKCHKDTILKQQQAKLAATSIENIVNGSSSSDAVLADAVDMKTGSLEFTWPQQSPDFTSGQNLEMAPALKLGPNRCASCHKRVGLTGFNCRCGSLFCSVHRYSDKHECPFDYRAAAQDAIAKANPVVKADKIDKM